MALFGRSKNEDLEDEEEFEDPSYAKADASRYAPEGKGNFSKRRFRDLTPQNRKKRKEPVKPWGKKERIIVLVILLTTVITAAVLALGARNKDAFRFSLPKFDFSSLNIFKEETIIVRKK